MRIKGLIRPPCAQEFPAIRFRAAAPPGEEFPPGLESRLLVAQRIAVELHERLLAVQRAGAGGGRRRAGPGRADWAGGRRARCGWLRRAGAAEWI